MDQFEQFSTYFGLKVASQVFAASEQLSASIQSVHTIAQHAKQAAQQVLQYYAQLGSHNFTEYRMV